MERKTGLSPLAHFQKTRWFPTKVAFFSMHGHLAQWGAKERKTGLSTRISQWSQFSSSDRFRNRKAIPAEQINVPMHKR